MSALRKSLPWISLIIYLFIFAMNNYNELLIFVILISFFALYAISKHKSEVVYISSVIGVLILLSIIIYHTNMKDYYISSYNLNIHILSDRIYVVETLNYKFSSPKHELYRYFKLPTHGKRRIENMVVRCSSGTAHYKKYYLPTSVCSGYYNDSASMQLQYDIIDPFVDGKMNWIVMDDVDTYIKKVNVNIKGNYKKYYIHPLNKVVPPGGVLEVGINLNDIFYKIHFYLDTIVCSIIFIATIAFIPFYVYIWKKYGKEKEFSVPDVIHFAPKNRKPYIVNYLFNGIVGLDNNAIMATLVDLALRGYIKLDKDSIKFLKGPEGLDDFERKVYDTFKNVSRNGVFKPSYARMAKARDKSRFSKLTDPTENMKKLLNSYLDTRGINIISISLTILLIITIVSYFILKMNIYVLFASDKILYLYSLTVQTVLFASIFINMRIFGKFKPEIQKEFLMWSSFKNMLSDESLIRKYSTKDIRMWKKWLVYATALGCASTVIKEMRKFNIKIENVDTYLISHSSIISSSFSSGSGYSGGASGFSGGVSFGGGGVGAR